MAGGTATRAGGEDRLRAGMGHIQSWNRDTGGLRNTFPDDTRGLGNKEQTRRTGWLQAGMRLPDGKTHTFGGMRPTTADVAKTNKYPGEAPGKKVHAMETSSNTGLDDRGRCDRERVNGPDEHAS